MNLGCGPVQPEGWINVDYSHRARLKRMLPPLDWLLTTLRVLPPTEFSSRIHLIDLRKRLPFGDGTIAAFYCGEVLEHFTLQQTRALLAECVRALRPGGLLRACVPDNYAFWKHYCREVEQLLSQPRSQWPAEGMEKRMQAFFRDICVDRPGLRSMGHFHKWAYDEISMIKEFERAGLEQVERRQPLESAIADVEQVEVRQRGGFLIIEGRKVA